MFSPLTGRGLGALWFPVPSATLLPSQPLPPTLAAPAVESSSLESPLAPAALAGPMASSHTDLTWRFCHSGSLPGHQGAVAPTPAASLLSAHQLLVPLGECWFPAPAELPCGPGPPAVMVLVTVGVQALVLPRGRTVAVQRLWPGRVLVELPTHRTELISCPYKVGRERAQCLAEQSSHSHSLIKS